MQAVYISLLPISPVINILHCCGTLVAIDEPILIIN